MRIEDEIKQQNFSNEFIKAHINVIYTAAWDGLSISHILNPFHISHQQFNVLRILRSTYPEPDTVRALKDRMIDQTSNASRLVDRLIEKGLVKKCNSTIDKRMTNVYITAEGISLIEKAMKLVLADVRSKYKRLTRDEAATLNQLLDKVRG